MVAIASFLAELRVLDNRAAIVFDDPVSSLDHKWRARVAKRLVQEARTRQVVVFTHDIVFLMRLKQEAEDQQVCLSAQQISRSATEIGICSALDLYKWLTVGGLQLELQHKLGSIRRLPTHDRHGPYRKEIFDFYRTLRVTWETTVREKLLCDVVQPFRREIHTKRLLEVGVEDSDFVTVERAMSRCSFAFGGHAPAPAEADEPLPTPSDAAEDLKILEVFLKTLKERRNRLKAKRERMLTAPRPASRGATV